MSDASPRTPQVSICVPVYNGSRYLDACLESISKQRMTDFDVLVLDDQSIDDSVAIARRWSERDVRFSVMVNERNLGLVGNWNRCIESTRGRWIKFLFQDDWMEPDCLSRMLEAAEGGGGFAACERQVVYEGSVAPELREWYEMHKRLLGRIYGHGTRLSPQAYVDAKLSALDFNVVGEPSVTLIARELFDRFGFFDPLLIHTCDSDMWNRLGANVGVDYVAGPLVAFRVHEHAASESNRRRRFRAFDLDAIIELSRLCYHPALSPFRDFAKSSGKGTVASRRLSARMHSARETARRAADGSAPDGERLRELEGVLGALPAHRDSLRSALKFRLVVEPVLSATRWWRSRRPTTES